MTSMFSKKPNEKTTKAADSIRKELLGSGNSDILKRLKSLFSGPALAERISNNLESLKKSR